MEDNSKKGNISSFNIFRYLRNQREYFIILIFVVVIIVFGILTHGIFLSRRNISLLLRQGAILSITASCMTLIIIGGNFDLAVGSAVYLVSVILSMVQVVYGRNDFITIVTAICSGAFLGAWQGLWIAKTKIPSFIVTLAGLSVYRGLGYFWTNAATIFPVSKNIQNLSEGYITIRLSLIIVIVIAILASSLEIAANFKTSKKKAMIHILQYIIVAVVSGYVVLYQGIPMAAVFMLVVCFVLHFILRRTRFGRNIYVIGGNKEAAILAGITIQRHILLSFIIMGCIYGIAGLLITARLGGASPSTGMMWELNAIAAAVIGGTSLSGGIGTVGGAVIGAMLLTSIDNGMSLMNISSFLQMMVKGLILLMAVWFDTRFRK